MLRHGLGETTVVSGWVGFSVWFWVKFLKFKKPTGLGYKVENSTQLNPCRTVLILALFFKK